MDQSGKGVDHQRRSHDDEEVTLFEIFLDALEKSFRKTLPEEHDVRLDQLVAIIAGRDLILVNLVWKEKERSGSPWTTSILLKIYPDLPFMYSWVYSFRHPMQ